MLHSSISHPILVNKVSEIVFFTEKSFLQDYSLLKAIDSENFDNMLNSHRLFNILFESSKNG